VKLAYADPPYPGCAHLYKGHPDYAGEVDHVELLYRLQGSYDGWALSTSSKALGDMLHITRQWNRVRVLIWVKNTVRYAWEPILVSSARRPGQHLRDWLHCEPDAFQWRPKPDDHVLGAKPQPFCRWLFDWMGAEPGDELDDLFPGSGAVGRVWQEFSAQTRLIGSEPTVRSTKRAGAKAIRAHPMLDVFACVVDESAGMKDTV
jgi:hypothetical protein